MISTMRDEGGIESRVLILAPTANDARLTAEFLSREHVTSVVCRVIPEVCERLAEGCGALLLAEEILSDKSVSRLVDALALQPAWSDLPIIVISSGGEVSQTRLRRWGVFGSGGNVTLLERPFRPSTLVSAVDVALRARRRQHEVRRLLQELEEARDAAEAANRAKDHFLAALSHELRTPLTPVLMAAAARQLDPDVPEQIRNDLVMIQRNVELETKLIDDLLDLSRITSGKLHLRLETVLLNDAVRDVCEICRTQILEKGIRLHCDLDEQIGGVTADTSRLHQVLWNVLKNAAKFTPERGEIWISTRASGDGMAQVVVRDDGAGIPREILPKIFEAFEQGRPEITRKFGGLGLGLAISKALMEMHCGAIRVESEGIGKGSSFFIELPRAAPEKIESSGEFDDEEMPTGALRLLVVEDHVDTAMMLSQLLKMSGYSVKIAGSVATALAAAEREKFDMLISDLGLPDATGYDLIKKIRETQNLMGIAMSGYGMDEDIQRSREAGFCEHLVKPVDITVLEKAIHRLAHSS